MKERIESFASADGKSKVCAYIFESEKPKAILQISHGMCEHIGRYRDFAEYLTGNGYIVCGNDHLGHGKTSGDGLDGYFAEKDGRIFVLKDLKKMNDYIQQQYPNLPIILLGHSMGSFFARWFAEVYSSSIHALILSGTGGPSMKIRFGAYLSGFLTKLYGPKYVSSFVEKAGMGSYLNKVEHPQSPHDWISRDREIVNAYSQDSKCTFSFTVSAYHELLCVHKHVNQRAWANKMDKKLPILLFSGDKDPVGDYGKGVDKVYKMLLDAGLTDLTLKLYPGGRHEMLNEINRTEVYADILGWLNFHF
mgnify:CR=1 FL=1